jgi:hypothetical protein
MLRIALAAPLAALSLGPLASAHAAVGVACTILDTLPHSVAVGVTPERVTFDVVTDCDADRDVSWAITSDIYPGSSGASWLMLRNYDYPYGEKFTFTEDPNGHYVLDPAHSSGPATLSGNGWAGVRPLHASAFYDANHDGIVQEGEPVSNRSSSFILKRATTFGDTFHVSYDARKKQVKKIRVTGRLQRADWDTATFADLEATVTLQFRAAGATEFVDVKRVTTASGVVETTAKVTTSGTWRYRYDGDAVSGETASPGVFVATR